MVGPMNPIHIAVLNSHPIQYFAPLYAYLDKEEDFEITVIYLSDFSIRGGTDPGFGQPVKWDVDLLSGYRSVFLGSRAKKRNPGGFWSLVAPEVWSEIRCGRYDILLLMGHHYAANLIAMAAAKVAGLPIFMRCETHLGLQQSYAKKLLRPHIVGSLYKLCDRCLAIGSENAEFYKSIGIDPERIYLVPYAVDNTRFMADVESASRHRESVRKELGLSDVDPVILYASKLTRRKHPDDLIRAAKRLRSEGYRFHVLMVGTGEMERELKELVADLRMDNVVFTGFVNQSALPKLYASSDLFVLPSEDEPWGVVINEAMCAGLPVIASEGVGSVSDLVVSGVNGLTFKPKDINALTNALRTVISSPTTRDGMAIQSKKHIAEWSYKECLEGLRDAIDEYRTKENRMWN